MIDLRKLITDKTPIINLDDSNYVSKEEKEKAIGLSVDSFILNNYLTNMYFKDGKWYYFKNNKEKDFPFGYMDELLGSYLSQERNLQTVRYNVAKVSDTYGLASVNFKTSDNIYLLLTDILKDDTDPLGLMTLGLTKLEILKNCTINEENKYAFLNHLFDLFALDIYMLQKDRCNVNLQFMQNKKTGYFDLAPIYDYELCGSRVSEFGIEIPSRIVSLYYDTIIELAKKYPIFYEKLKFCLEQNMAETWDIICDDYCFNKDTSEYERIMDYYEVKDKRQKKYIREMISHVK